jgi:hypothetical protein
MRRAGSGIVCFRHRHQCRVFSNGGNVGHQFESFHINAPGSLWRAWPEAILSFYAGGAISCVREVGIRKLESLAVGWA